ncbi:Uncharacterized protein F383_30467 [Gossypium arboreum]|uniref:Uncharacterized protein n=1 Tax=Gossypium arboreum TaxID=29729 RepID=A0A0B0PJN4_GOSAR|nr:Uncharacterized protein F383_30467 [Gossypium arboreum]
MLYVHTLPSQNNFILILIVDIPNEPLGIKKSNTLEKLHKRCHISINGPAHASCQLRRSYRCCSHKLSSNRNICRYTQPPMGRTGPASGSHNIIP